jgi:hypothetical protein
MINYEEAKDKILLERPWVNRKPYYHNIIISIILQQVSNDIGMLEADRLVRECNLKELGWEEETTKSMLRKLTNSK